MLTDQDHAHLAHCVELARHALAGGNQPFGSVLVDAAGAVLFEDHNRDASGDGTRHPELAIAQWAAAHLSPSDRAAATVYTSGEHCPMCAAAHAWAGLGRIVFASSSAQLAQWLDDLGAPAPPVATLAINQVAPGTVTLGPVPEYAAQVRELHRLRHTG